MESMRKDPDKYSSIIYYSSVLSITNNGSVFHNASYTAGQQQLQYPSFESFFEAYKTMLLDDAEKLYKNLVKEWVNRIIINYVSNRGLITFTAQ